MNAFTMICDSIEEVESKLNEAVAHEFTPTLSLIFSSVSLDYLAVRDLFDSRGIQVYGSTTAGEIVDEEVRETSVAVMLLDIDPKYFQVHFAKAGSRPTREVSNEIGRKALESFDRPAAIVTSGGIATDGEEIIKGIQQVLGFDAPLYGGLAGDDFQMQNTYVFTNDQCTENGLVALVLDTDYIEVRGIATSGWEAIGIEKTITRSEGNIVYSIDDEPAADVFIKYFGLTLNLEDRSSVVDAIGVNYPLQVVRKNGESVIRAPLMGNETDRSLVFAGAVPEGAKVKFSVPPGFDVVDKAIADTHNLKITTPQADALLLFSCKARHIALGPLIEDEVRGLQQLWDSPLVGFFTYGEIGNVEGNACDFHNETCCMVVLNEKQKQS